MYIPPHFAEADPAEVARLIDAYPLASMVAQTAEGLVANHLPVLSEGDRIIGHVARANRLHELVADGQEVLLIFRGQDGYVSPNWYPSKAETHKVVPTWNYQVVHMLGRIRWDDSDKFKRRAVALLTRKMEGAAGWKMGDAPRDYLDGMLAAIVGFEVQVEQVLAKTKLSQNRADADFDAVKERFEDQGRGALSDRMARMPRGGAE
ncbi:FMN-binding negative transcriptional regulator [Fuscibacter oryzae]|uniref:FMN-binding negative transcriptional regulator n=1 Tax=Fuscibacter oryzae TaxID=2803939 RepID=A0A8J7MPY8_9RHOB|nr:FMN-binding negative transcriptional regulator [Fuscibacter oryzae]MBL4927613.1 FMN-binding negative transcriptional regulator [Fuscibacter oryzae]